MTLTRYELKHVYIKRVIAILPYMQGQRLTGQDISVTLIPEIVAFVKYLDTMNKRIESHALSILPGLQARSQRTVPAVQCAFTIE